MSDDAGPRTCQQAVSAEGSCCVEGTCEAPATWWHPGSEAALCDEHELNAQRWSSGGTWRVGSREVPYPAGWERVGVDAEAGPALRAVELGGGIVVERDPLTR